ncbi:ABC-type nitrate/sulfonate/bicarbonate transport systems [Blastochloris viridis]|uniref:ABC-type nitrate/sulfonate/bicarbonate transport systems n=1 Tax=Blastochloris viridis TaxID=1079 RepID=A0A182D5N6_BLAVI|nr:ABC-type nitrate/sulfonate/bicarbonate transport systems [Blastochloris viridis]
MTFGLAIAAGAKIGEAYGVGVRLPDLPPEFRDFPICRASTRIDVPDPKGPPRKIRFAYNGTGICTAAVPVALHRGYFTRHNLDVEFVQLAGSIDQMLQALATDKADAGVSMALNWLKPLEGGFDVKLTTGMHGGCTRLLVHRDSGITDIAQLRGRSIGVSNLAGTPRHFFSVMLADKGLNPDKDVEWREFPADLLPVALQRGEVNALADSDPAVWLARLRSNGELVEIASNLSGDYANLTCCVLGIRASLLREDRAVAAALTAASLEAAAHVAANPDDAAAVFAPYTPKVPVGELAAMLRSHTHDHHPAGDELRKELVRIITDLKRASVLRQSTDPNKFAARIVENVFD